ncbi:hypothetical protein AtubIFM56815_008456 [Aspergillus tubingensis]|uniref:Uncharacterized protein n=2 Tax=Aspergillus subgen. Circumdati TaxID=2720871 RepID=A0A100IKP5_ASPNG|nr:sugar (and other) transporter family protein [Aspergillus tubingensis]GAQ43005.1 hypothetical protein ANI_1_1106124 [Aspergillus niger]GFN10886.1 sugar (and other) transporter family protein [Aspergillus tubingensis]GLA65286.1 hypothetical protein AtubIFM54640_007036 [Aspergillus tubingensis]GLA84245.1 hypothetical protein AtubIFM56815_008456 [Aspergillus tubingensis]GLA99704.1 hypothetical protein AtubIFM57143_008402 [Aspergillus tubingensis]
MHARRSTTQPEPFRHVDVCRKQSSASLGSLKFGKLRVDCCWLKSKTQWGKLRGQDTGLIYLNLTFHQPADCKLSQATITINFHEVEYFSGRNPKSDLEITEFFGPQILTGEKRERQVSETLEAIPRVGAANVNVEGIGVSRKSQVTYASRWKFTGSRFTDNSLDDSYVASSRYRQLIWHLEENDLDRQAVHHSIVHTALAFHHDTFPFYIVLQIEVKMQRRHHRALQHLVCPPRGRNAPFRTTIEPVGSKTDDPKFARLVRNIDQAMVRKNLHPVAEVSDPKPAATSDDSEINHPDENYSINDGPSGPLLGVAQRLCGNKPSGISALRRRSSSASTKSVNSSSKTTLVGYETMSQPDDQAGIRPADCEADDLLIVNSTKQTIKATTIHKHASIVALSVVRHASQLLAALIAWLILGLNELHTWLARTGKGLERD